MNERETKERKKKVSLYNDLEIVINYKNETTTTTSKNESNFVNLIQIKHNLIYIIYIFFFLNIYFD